MNIKTAYKLIIVISLIAILALMPSGISRLILILIVITESTILFKTEFVDSKRQEWIKKLSTIVFSFVFIFFLLECVFMFIKRSNPATNLPLASRNWFNKYYNPYINSYGFRDEEPTKNDSSIFFIGDSFTAGDGIKKTNDRFSNIVKEKLLDSGKSLHVINMGLQGADTKKEYETMVNFINSTGIRPKFVVLQYFGNDIEDVANENGVKLPEVISYQKLNILVKNIIKRSYFLNYLYWLGSKQIDYNVYLKFIEEGYSNDSIFHQHKQDIQHFLDFTKTNNIPLLVVIFPFMNDLEFSKRVYINKLKNFFNENKVNYLDVSTLIEELSIKERIVNSSDGHASVYVNKLVGDVIYNKIFQVYFE